MYEAITNTASFIQSRVPFKPQVGIILGSGLGGVVEQMEVVGSIPYAEIPNFPTSTVEGHSGALVFGYLGSQPVVAMQGRFHYYEGYTPQQVVFPVRVMAALSIKSLFVSNASGGVNPAFEVGDLMVIEDHISLIPNPLIGKNIEQLGTRFPDMSEPYDRELIALSGEVADELDIPLRKGCYLSNTGPTYETQSEYRFYRIVGADAVGMSTTPEVIAARHMQLPVFAISVITNLGLSAEKATHEEVQREGAKAAEQMTRLMIGMLEKMSNNAKQ